MADDLHPVRRDLYESDYLAWTEAQAAALRARATVADDLDYDNLAEEIEDLGKAERFKCESQVDNILVHLLKIEFVGPVETIPHWRGEVFEFRRELERHLTRTIENRIRPNLDVAFHQAVKRLVIRGAIADADAVLAHVSGYGWDRVVDPDWYPRPRYG